MSLDSLDPQCLEVLRLVKLNAPAGPVNVETARAARHHFVLPPHTVWTTRNALHGMRQHRTGEEERCRSFTCCAAAMGPTT